MSTQPRLPASDAPIEHELKAPLVLYLTQLDEGERLELDGHNGSNRRRTGDGKTVLGCAEVPANTDLAAAARFLRSLNNPHTYRGYRREILRLFMWALMVRRKPVSSLTLEDIDHHYRAFLINPPKEWRGERRAPLLDVTGRLNPHWRPFVGPDGLRPGSVKLAMDIISTMLSWWRKAGYLDLNPLDLLRDKGGFGKPATGYTAPEQRAAAALKPERYLTPLQMDAVWEAASARGPRDRWIVALFRYSGMRIEEAAVHQMRNFKETNGEWWLEIIGKRNKNRRIPVVDELLTELDRYRKACNLDSRPGSQDDAPLIATKGGKPMTTRHITRLLKPIFLAAAETLRVESPQSAERLEQASPHWFRHTWVTNLLNKQDINPKHVQVSAGHTEFATTSRYNHSEDHARHASIRAAGSIL